MYLRPHVSLERMCIHAHVRVCEGLQRQVLLLGFRSTVAVLPPAAQLADKLYVHTLHPAFQLPCWCNRTQCVRLCRAAAAAARVLLGRPTAGSSAITVLCILCTHVLVFRCGAR